MEPLALDALIRHTLVDDRGEVPRDLLIAVLADLQPVDQATDETAKVITLRRALERQTKLAKKLETDLATALADLRAARS